MIMITQMVENQFKRHDLWLPFNEINQTTVNQKLVCAFLADILLERRVKTSAGIVIQYYNFILHPKDTEIYYATIFSSLKSI